VELKSPRLAACPLVDDVVSGRRGSGWNRHTALKQLRRHIRHFAKIKLGMKCLMSGDDQNNQSSSKSPALIRFHKASSVAFGKSSKQTQISLSGFRAK
jgi:hypothetical protein